MCFRYNIVYMPGKETVSPDTLSRAPVPGTKRLGYELCVGEVKAFAAASVSAVPSSTQLDEVNKAQGEDSVCNLLKHYCESGWPQKYSLPK